MRKYQSCQVNSQESFLNWTKDTLVPFMFPTARYNNGPLDYFDKRYVSDMNNLRVGTVRLRQVRSENGNVSLEVHLNTTQKRLRFP